jgi:hypothetical protein
MSDQQHRRAVATIPVKTGQTFLTVLLLTGMLLGLISGPGMAATQLPSAFLQNIYKHYVGKNTAGVKLDSDADYKRYFTPAMAKIILDDQAAAAKNGDVPTLDGDPFIDAQDWQIAKFKVDVDDKATDKTVGKVSFTNIDKAETISLDLVKVDGAWKIDDIHWPEDSLRGIYKH